MGNDCAREFSHFLYPRVSQFRTTNVTIEFSKLHHTQITRFRKSLSNPVSTLKLLQNSLHSHLEIDQRVHVVELLEFFTNLVTLFMSSNCPSLKSIFEVTHTLIMIPHCTTTIPSSSSMMALTNFGPEGTRKQTNVLPGIFTSSLNQSIVFLDGPRSS